MSFAEKYVGFWFSFSIPTFLFLICFPILMIFRTKYVRNPPSGSLLPSVLRIFWHCTKPCVSWNPIKTYKLMKADGFWERAKPSKIPLESRPKWMTFDDLWVLKTRRSFKACQVFVLLPIYQLSYNQMSSNLVAQAATMKLNGTPNQIVQNLDPLAISTLSSHLFSSPRHAQLTVICYCTTSHPCTPVGSSTLPLSASSRVPCFGAAAHGSRISSRCRCYGLRGRSTTLYVLLALRLSWVLVLTQVC